MMEMMQQMQQSQNVASDENTGSGSSPLDFLKGIMDPEQQSMFDMYNDIFSNAADAANTGTQKGETDYE